MNAIQGLKDIKDIVEVPDYSLYFLIAITGVILFSIAYLIYLYLTRIKKTEVKTPREIALQNLKNIDFSDVKKVAYTFSVDGFLFIDDKNRDEFEMIEKDLQQYKYRKKVNDLDEKLKERIVKFIKALK